MDFFEGRMMYALKTYRAEKTERKRKTEISKNEVTMAGFQPRNTKKEWR